MLSPVIKQRVRIALLAISVVLAFGIIFGDRGVISYFSLRKQNQQVTKTLSDLRAEEISLKDQILQLEQGGIHLERFARERLGLVAADEIVYEFRVPVENTEEIK